ncbi:MAG: DUF5107 domain-containing protein [Oscillospiraceae bacterium]|nr:DUF5107 domain-containing protein [Oscillospiraceae bacterium]
MSTVRFTHQNYEMADFGPLNPLPDFQNVSYVHSTVVWDDTLGEEDVRYMRYGRVGTILPYLSQDRYTREKKSTEKEAVILENEYLRAEFLPWMGGRLWSLEYEGRELLNHNPVVQPCNLALRNAWCSGGVEWNVSIRGHNMLTCENMFTELIRLEDGTCGVRLYEYERIRGIVYRIEAYLPPESRFLFVQVHIENPEGNGEVPMYWWSNIAVPQREGTRVIAPAKTAILSLYDAGQYRMLRRSLPVFEGMDLSRPCEISRSVDVFYDLPEEQLPFITALQSDHKGLVQLSTRRMMGRKLFVWGVGEGGRNWQRWLSDGIESYIEIQAGIARTQQDHIPMPDGTVWNWLEAYGQLTCSVDQLEYAEAADACREALDKVMPREALEAEHRTRAQAIARAEGEIVFTGSGWGALENLRRAKNGMGPVSQVCRFPASSMDTKQAAWLELMDENTFPALDPLTAPESYMNAKVWREMLAGAENKNAHALYHLGVMQNAAGDAETAERTLRESIAAEPSPWAWRALARMALIAGNEEECLAAYGEALKLLPGEYNLVLEYAQTLLNTGRFAALDGYLAALPEDYREQPRFLYLQASAAVQAARYDEAEAILLRPLFIPDMREGELSLCDLWFTLYMKKHGISRSEAEKRFPLPHELDFRMHE